MPQRSVATNFTFEQQRQEINLLAADFWTQKGTVDTAASTYLKHDGSNNFTGANLAVPNAFTINANSGSGTVTISGNLDVTGTTTTVSSANLEVTDKNILIAKGSTSDSQADGAGITIDSGTDITFNFVDAKDALVSSIGLEGTTFLKAPYGQFTGSGTPGGGQGVEINAPDTNTGQIISYDRANTAYKELRLKGSSVGIYGGTTNALVGSFSSTGLSVTGTITASDDVTITGNKTLKVESSSSGDYVRMYAGGGTGKWDIYGNGANLRFSDNESAGSVVFDRNVDANGGLDVTGNLTSDTFIQVLGSAGTSDKGLEVRSNSGQTTNTNKALRVRNNSDTDTFSVSYRGSVDFSDNLSMSKSGVGVALFRSTDDDMRVRIRAADDKFSQIEFADDDADAGEIRYKHATNNADYMAFHVGNNVEHMRLTNNGLLELLGTQRFQAYDTAGGGGGYSSTGLVIGNAYDAGKTTGITDDRNGIIWQERGIDIDFATQDTFRMKLTYDGKLLLGTTSSNTSDCLTILDPGNAFMSLRSDAHADLVAQHLDFIVGTGNRASGNMVGAIRALVPDNTTAGGTLKGELSFWSNSGDSITENLTIKSDGAIDTGTKTITGGNNLAIQSFRVKGVWSGGGSIGKEIEMLSGYDSGVKMAAIGYNLTDTSSTSGGTYGGDLVFHSQPLYSSPTTPLPERLRVTSHGTLFVSKIDGSDSAPSNPASGGNGNGTSVVNFVGSEIGGTVVSSVADNAISPAIKASRRGCFAVITPYSNPSSTGDAYPQPNTACIAYLDLGPSKNIQILSLGTVGTAVVAKNSYDGTATNSDNNKLTIMAGQDDGYFHLVNREGNSEYRYKITFI